MSITGQRLLIRSCATCGRTFSTSSTTPWKRLINGVGTMYYCSESCKKASYKHLFDGKAEERRKAREAKRDRHAYNHKYYEAHREQEKARQRERYYADIEASRATIRFNHYKRKLLGGMQNEMPEV